MNKSIIKKDTITDHVLTLSVLQAFGNKPCKTPIFYQFERQT